jgi:AcrR family transcriptional regulator
MAEPAAPHRTRQKPDAARGRPRGAAGGAEQRDPAGGAEPRAAEGGAGPGAAAGLREQKKARTRAAIADAAAGLFARDGYPSVTMAQIAAAAAVADQTLYNYFPTKESLVFDRSGDFAASLTEALTSRPPGTGLADAFAAWLDQFLLSDAARRSVRSAGGMPRLVARSDALRRALLDLAHQFATPLAAQLAAAEGLPGPAALAIADALVAVFVRTVEQLGSATDEGALPGIRRQASAAIDALRPLTGTRSR